MNELEHQLNLLQREMREKDKQLSEERAENERVTVNFIMLMCQKRSPNL